MNRGFNGSTQETRRNPAEKIRDGSLNNLDKSIYSLVDRETTKHAKGAKLMTGKIVFKEQSDRIIGACFDG